MKFGNITIGKQLFVGWGKPTALGKGENQIRGAAYVEGPMQIGKDSDFDEIDDATLMVGHENNTDKDEQIGEYDLLAFEDVKRQNILSRFISSINFLIWGDV